MFFRVALKGVILGLIPCLLASQSFAANRMMERLERGETIVMKQGSSFAVQALLKKDPEAVGKTFADLDQLPKFFENVAFVQSYVTEDAKPRRFVYLKLRGLGNGLGVLMEVKAATSTEAFASAKSLVIEGESLRSRSTAAEVDLSNDPIREQLAKDIADEAKKAPTVSRSVDAETGIVLEGPLNDVLQAPSLRLTINFAYAPYTITVKEDVTKYTLMMAKVAFGSQTPREELGDYRGFGDKNLSVATLLGERIFSRFMSAVRK